MAYGINPLFGAPGGGSPVMGNLADQSMGAYLNSLGQMPHLVNSAAASAAAQINQAQAIRTEVMQRARLAAQARADEQARQAGIMMMGLSKQQQDAQRAWAALQQHALLTSLDRTSRERMNTQDNATRAALTDQEINARRELADAEGKTTDPAAYSVQLAKELGYGDIGAADAMGMAMVPGKFQTAMMGRFPHAFPNGAKTPADHFNNLALKAIRGDTEARKQLADAQADPVLAPMIPGYSKDEQLANQPLSVRVANSVLNDFHEFTKQGMDPAKILTTLAPFAKQAYAGLPADSPIRNQLLARFGNTIIEQPPQVQTPGSTADFSSAASTLESIGKGAMYGADKFGRGVSNVAAWLLGGSPDWWYSGWSGSVPPGGVPTTQPAR